MCGSVGILHAPNECDPRRLVAVEPMATLHHRGPDAGDVCTAGANMCTAGRIVPLPTFAGCRSFVPLNSGD